MNMGDAATDSIFFQWNFYERTISNYSILTRIFQYVEDGDKLVDYMSKVFVEETIFDSCQIIKHRDWQTKEGFFTIDDALRPIAADVVDGANARALSPTFLNNHFGYGTLYIYPLKKDITIFGYLVLGRMEAIPLEQNMSRELELLCEMFNKALVLNGYIIGLRSGEETRHRGLDSKLLMAQTLIENVIDQFPNCLLLIDKNGRICFANEKAKTEFNDRRDLLIGEKLENVLPGITEDFYEKDLLLQGTIQYRSKGEYKFLDIESYPIKDDEGTVIWKSVVLKDVADGKIGEEESIQKGKMESVGRLAGGIAHDFNNLLTGVLGYASLIKKAVTDDKQLFRYAEVIESSAKRAATLTQHLLNFSRRQRRSAGSVEINALLDDVLFLLKQSLRNIETEIEFEKFLPPVKGDESQLQNVFLNVLVNCRDAMPDGGKLRVRTERKSYIGNKEFAKIEIEDTGCGMDENVKSRIFEPYFTTKEDATKLGTKLGIGMYLVDRVIRAHGGLIELESTAGQGTKFTIYLPLQVREKKVVKMQPAQVAPPPPKKTILIVDDEEVIRELVSGIVKKEGFDLSEAADGKTAIEIFSKEASRIDLVILDMIMPGMPGEDVLREIRRISPKVKVVVSSGFMSEEQRDKLKEFGVDGYLDKPFGDKEVADIIQTVRSQSEDDSPLS